MSTEEFLRDTEDNAVNDNQFVSNVTGRTIQLKSSKKFKSFSAGIFIIALILVFALFFSTGNIIPTAINDRIIEETDVQYADGVESKKLVFQQALQDGNIPDDTASILKEKGFTVGYLDASGNFIESNKSSQSLSLKSDDKIISADDFITEISTNINLYNAFTAATYDRAAYYYDESAEKVFKEIGTNRDNYTEDSDFDTVMDETITNGSDIEINSVSLVKKTRVNQQTGKQETYYEYESNGTNAKSSSSDAQSLINSVIDKNAGNTREDSSLYSAASLQVADTVSKEQRSSLFFLTFMENISKMKAGKGNESNINEAMDYLYKEETSETVDTKTGEVVTTKGTALDSPSLYAILSGSSFDTNEVKDYSSERITKTIQNQISTTSENIVSSIKNTVASTTSKIKSAIGRFIESGSQFALSVTFAPLVPTISSSLMENSFASIKGVAAGEFLVEGAVNVGKQLAISGSGATAGDESAVVAYQKTTQDILAMDAEIDRINRSPFDITSKNTFLGSLFYKYAIIANSSSIISGITTFSQITNNSILSLIPGAYAESTNTYLTNYGECDTLNSIGAVGSAHCSTIATFDITTLDDTFNDTGFINFVNSNTTLNDDGSRTINQNSTLANFILYNNERKTPIGVNDGSIIESLKTNSTSTSYSSNITEMVKDYIQTTEENTRIASGAAFVNSSSNSDWQIYKYAQRYVSIARATSSLRQYSTDTTAYNNIKYFEGSENPVIAFLNNYYQENSIAQSY